MRSVRALLAGALFLCVGCATNVGVWGDSFPDRDRAALKSALDAGLKADHWTVLRGTGTIDLVAVKPGAGGHQTVAAITLVDGTGGGAGYELRGKSHHRVNWLTFGILGLSMKSKASATCAEFVRTFREKSPPQ